MLKVSIIPLVLVGSAVFYSCGPSKKLQGAYSEIENLKSINAQQASKNNALESALSNLTSSNNALNAEYSVYKTGCESTRGKLETYKSIVQKEYNTVKEVKTKIEAGVADFAGRGVEVYEKDGRICVNMEDELLYKSGSATIGKEGKKALAALALALNEYPKLKVIVVGHTDDVPFKKGGHTDNLALSTERANGVVRELRDVNKIDGSRLTAAGQGRFHPVADNSTKEGRAKNRRTEIILNPDLPRQWEGVQGTY